MDYNIVSKTLHGEIHCHSIQHLMLKNTISFEEHCHDLFLEGQSLGNSYNSEIKSMVIGKDQD